MSPKTKLGPLNALYPSLTTILGTEIDGRPNFITIAHVGILNHGQPQYLSFGAHKSHHSNQGIIKNKTFSVNIPGQDLVIETDYVGIVTGKTTDKSGVFDIFYGETTHAPMIKACPVCMECRLKETLDFGTHDIFVGEIVETHADESVLTAGKPDPAKVRPLLFDMGTIQYFGVGQVLGKCWRAGRELKRRLRGD